MEKGRGPGSWLCGLGAPRVHHEPGMVRSGSSPKSGSDDALAHRCSMAAAKKGEREVTNPLGTSPGSRRWRDGWAIERGGGGQSGSARAVLRARNGLMESGGEGSELRWGCAPLL
jgi:hypothetical protein